MDGEELKQFVPELLEAQYPGRSREADPHSGDIVPGGHLGWILDLDDCVVLVRASQTSREVAMVVFEETIVAAYLSMQYEPSIKDVVNRFENSLGYTSEWAKTIREKYGGQPFSADDWYLMSF